MKDNFMLEAEIEYLRETNKGLREYCDTLIKEIDKYYLEVSAKNREIEHLKEQLKNTRGDNNGIS